MTPLFRLIRLTAIAIGCLTIPQRAAPSEQIVPGIIVSPTTARPTTIGDDLILEVLVDLRLPLTPPPGVQQPAAVEGWTVSLVRNDVYTLSGAPFAATYRFPVMRLRPSRTKDVYRITVELAPWLLPGQYDVKVRGPGFQGVSGRSVRLGQPSPNRPKESVTVSGGENHHIYLRNPNPAPISFTLGLALPPDLPGIELRENNAAIRPSGATVAALRDGTPGRGRILTYHVTVPGSESGGTLSLTYLKKHKAACDGAIAWPDSTAATDAMAWRNLAWRSKGSPLTVIWNFNDGRWSTGREVRPRWLLKNEATVTARAIDEFGRTCDATSRYRLNTLSRDTGCSCGVIGRKR